MGRHSSYINLGFKPLGNTFPQKIQQIFQMSIQLPDLIKKEDFAKLQVFFTGYWQQSDPLAIPFVYIDNIFDQGPAYYFKWKVMDSSLSTKSRCSPVLKFAIHLLSALHCSLLLDLIKNPMTAGCVLIYTYNRVEQFS